MVTEASIRILYVDDEQGLALLGEEFLSSLGYEVTCAFSGPMAIEVFGQSVLTRRMTFRLKNLQRLHARSRWYDGICPSHCKKMELQISQQFSQFDHCD